MYYYKVYVLEKYQSSSLKLIRALVITILNKNNISLIDTTRGLNKDLNFKS